jgi:hypothetical protein
MASVSAVNEITISRITPPASVRPMRTLATDAILGSQVSAKGVTSRTSGSNCANSTTSTPMKIVELMAGGMAPRRNSRGLRTIRPNPRTSRPAPVASSDTAFATVATLAATGHHLEVNRRRAGGVCTWSDPIGGAMCCLEMW